MSKGRLTKAELVPIEAEGGTAGEMAGLVRALMRRKNAPKKLAIATRLRRETTLSIKTIAARVYLGTSNTANARLHQALRELRPPGSGQQTFGA